MDEFEVLLTAERVSVERFVRFRLKSQTDADDILQEVYLTACRNFGNLKNKASFKPWIISIARNKCNDYFRKRASRNEVFIDDLNDISLLENTDDSTRIDTVRDTLRLLREKDRQILYLYFWKDMPQVEIAKLLNIPLGTVKSRLFTAKKNFKNNYLYYTEKVKGDDNMKKMPEILPEYTIVKSNKDPFSVKCEELPWEFIIPKLGEKLSYGIYDLPSRKCSDIFNIEVTGKAKVHGIEGVEILEKHIKFSGELINEITMVAQLTNTHSRILATTFKCDDITEYRTFLDGEDFMIGGGGYGEDNCGNEINLIPKNFIKREGSVVNCERQYIMTDIVGRYTVTIGGESYDTICVLDIDPNDSWITYEKFLDKNGRTILWRRYNRNERAMNCYGGKTWSERFPENEQLTINGELYIHEYDIITDYIL